MSRTSMCRWILVLALGLIGGASSASAATPLSWGRLLSEEGRSAWTWIESLAFEGHLPLPTAWFRSARCGTGENGQVQCPDPGTAPLSKHNCGIDPNGQPYCAP